MKQCAEANMAAVLLNVYTGGSAWGQRMQEELNPCSPSCLLLYVQCSFIQIWLPPITAHLPFVKGLPTAGASTRPRQLSGPLARVNKASYKTNTGVARSDPNLLVHAGKTQEFVTQIVVTRSRAPLNVSPQKPIKFESKKGPSSHGGQRWWMRQRRDSRYGTPRSPSLCSTIKCSITAVRHLLWSLKKAPHSNER